MAGAMINHMRKCTSFIKSNEIRLKKRHKTKLFQPTGKIDNNPIAILESQPKTSLGNQ